MTLLGNSSEEIIVAAVVAGATFGLLTLLKAYGSRRLSRPSTGLLRTYSVQLLNVTGVVFLLAVSALAGLSVLDLPAKQETWLHHAWIIVVMLQVAMWGNRIVTVAIQRAFERQRQSNPAVATHISVIGFVSHTLLWTFVLLMALENLGFNVTALVASLGIGGVAIALAAQNILGDVFASIAIALDKPFVIGDFIVVDQVMGNVEYVGLKTTRIRSLGGEQIVIANADLLKSRIRNYRRMRERRIEFDFGVTYATPPEKIERIPQMVKQAVAAQSKTRFDRAHFKNYGESALQFEVVYYVTDPDYNAYMNIQQAINVALLRKFRDQDIEFAYPTRTLLVEAAKVADKPVGSGARETKPRVTVASSR
jgi:small-conductance mechanosensitive channel